MKKLLLLLAAGAVSCIVAAPVGSGADGFTFSTSFPIDTVVNVPCANGGAGEDVHITGTIHDLFHITVDAAGGLHVKTHDNPQDVTGVGLTTGASYQGTGVTQQEFDVTAGEQDTFVDNFRIVGQGPGNNFLVHETFHLTVNANGDVTVVFDNLSVDCT